MNRLEMLVFEVNNVFAEISQRFNSFQNQSGLTCLESCGRCCNHPEISCSLLEALPFAYDVFMRGESDSFKERLEKKDSEICSLFQPMDLIGEKGFCTQYDFRPGICRMFGAYARKGKDGSYGLGLCKTIKELYTEMETSPELDYTLDLSHWRNLIVDIDPYLGEKLLPINEALLKAIYYVEDYFFRTGAPFGAPVMGRPA